MRVNDVILPNALLEQNDFLLNKNRFYFFEDNELTTATLLQKNRWMLSLIQHLRGSEYASAIDVDSNYTNFVFLNKLFVYNLSIGFEFIALMENANFIMKVLSGNSDSAINPFHFLTEDFNANVTDYLIDIYTNYEHFTKSDIKVNYRFAANTELIEISDSFLNKNINKFINVDSFRKLNDEYFRDILSESTFGVFPSTGIFKHVFKNNITFNDFNIKNRRLLTATNNLVLPTMCLLNF